MVEWKQEQFDSFAKQWEEKISKDELTKNFDENLKEEKDRHPSLTEDESKFRALRLTGIQLKRIALVPTTQFSGFIYSYGDIVDMGVINYKKAKAIYEENPEKALREKLVKVDGDDIIPLDNREKFNNGNKNPNYGKPLPKDNKFRVVHGIARKNGELNYKPFVFSLNGNYANLSAPIFAAISFRGTLRNASEDVEVYNISSNTTTTFEKIDDTLNYKELLTKYGGKNITEYTKLIEWLEVNKDDRNALAIMEVDVLSLGITPSAKGNFSIAIGDGLDTAGGISGYMKPHVYDSLNFGTDSKIIAVGRPMIIEDQETQEENLLFELTGAWAYPEYIVPKPEPIEED